ncbi:hypothetical protein C8Q74DRAFT_534512 [Fomes fomentarius]|nr:hypothetical protein C8Q74DRAFT_534512 [Fomes fomentarius]
MTRLHQTVTVKLTGTGSEFREYTSAPRNVHDLGGSGSTHDARVYRCHGRGCGCVRIRSDKRRDPRDRRSRPPMSATACQASPSSLLSLRRSENNARPACHARTVCECCPRPHCKVQMIKPFTHQILTRCSCLLALLPPRDLHNRSIEYSRDPSLYDNDVASRINFGQPVFGKCSACWCILHLGVRVLSTVQTLTYYYCIRVDGVRHCIRPQLRM